MSGGIGVFLVSILSYPVLICSVLVAIVSITLLIVKRKTLKKEVKILLIILSAIAVVVIVFFAFMVIITGSNLPAAPPVPHSAGMADDIIGA